MKKLIPALLLIFYALFVQASEHWPQFRGPDGDGHSDARDLPLNWSETQNVFRNLFAVKRRAEGSQR